MQTSTQDFAKALQQFAVAAEKAGQAMKAAIEELTASPQFQESCKAFVEKTKPYIPVMERMVLTDRQKKHPYKCRRHQARIPANTPCPLCISDGYHNAGIIIDD